MSVPSESESKTKKTKYIDEKKTIASSFDRTQKTRRLDGTYDFILRACVYAKYALPLFLFGFLFCVVSAMAFQMLKEFHFSLARVWWWTLYNDHVHF